METKEYFEKVMRDYAHHKNGRSLRKYCQEEGIDYGWIMRYKRSMPASTPSKDDPVLEQQNFIPLALTMGDVPTTTVTDTSWSVMSLVLKTPQGAEMELKSNNLQAVSELLLKLIG